MTVTKIIIDEQVLRGNCGEATISEINDYIDELREELKLTADSYFPGVEVEINIYDSDCSGCSREMSVNFENDSDDYNFKTERACEDALNYVPQTVWERGNFWHVD